MDFGEHRLLGTLLTEPPCLVLGITFSYHYFSLVSTQAPVVYQLLSAYRATVCCAPPKLSKASRLNLAEMGLGP